MRSRTPTIKSRIAWDISLSSVMASMAGWSLHGAITSFQLSKVIPSHLGWWELCLAAACALIAGTTINETARTLEEEIESWKAQRNGRREME